MMMMMTVMMMMMLTMMMTMTTIETIPKMRRKVQTICNLIIAPLKKLLPIRWRRFIIHFLESLSFLHLNPYMLASLRSYYDMYSTYPPETDIPKIVLFKKDWFIRSHII